MERKESKKGGALLYGKLVEELLENIDTIVKPEA